MTARIGAYAIGAALCCACAPFGAGRVFGDEAADKARTAWEAGNYQQALEIWLLKAYEGDAEAQYRLGLMFARGEGAVVNRVEAVYWFTRAVEQGHAEAQYELGDAFFHGAGVAPDKDKAIEWWRQAAENGSHRAQYRIGRAYFHGADLDRDPALAGQWLARAAAGGNREAVDFLSRLAADDAASAPPEAAWKGFGRVGQRPVRVYASFNRHAPVMKILPPGSLVRVTGQVKGWFRAQLPGGIAVWASRGGVARRGGRHYIDGVGVHAHSDPGGAARMASMGVFLDGDEVTVLAEEGEWVHLQAPESITGWIEAIDVDRVPLESNVAEEWRAAREASLRESWTAAGLDPRFLTRVDFDAIGIGERLRVGAHGQNAYALARTDSTLIERLPAGLLVKVIYKSGGWVKAEAAGGVPLWVFEDYIEIDGGVGRIVGRGVHARPSPSVSDDPGFVAAYPSGARVRVLGRLGRWVRVRAPESLGAWMPVDNLYTVDAPPREVDEEWRRQREAGPEAAWTTMRNEPSAAPGSGTEDDR